ncbi:MAG: hypothetical protein JNL34_09335 [Anaerolineae bacterium]|nr:hypothetical protein [Anaerolineae bacterium]
MLDDLRRGTGSSGYDEPEEPEFPVAVQADSGERKFLGMTAVERMFLAIFVFLNVVVLGTALLLFTGRLVF